MPACAASRIALSCGWVSVAASGKSLNNAKWMCGSRFPRAWTSRCAISSSTLCTLSSSVGTITMVRAEAGTCSNSIRGNRLGGIR